MSDLELQLTSKIAYSSTDLAKLLFNSLTEDELSRFVDLLDWFLKTGVVKATPSSERIKIWIEEGLMCYHTYIFDKIIETFRGKELPIFVNSVCDELQRLRKKSSSKVKAVKYTVNISASPLDAIHNFTTPIQEIWVKQPNNKSFCFNDQCGVFFCEEPRYIPTPPICVGMVFQEIELDFVDVQQIVSVLKIKQIIQKYFQK